MWLMLSITLTIRAPAIQIATVLQEGIVPGTFNQLPPRYNDKNRSPFQVQVKEGDNHFPLALESRSPA
jgi:hypothetical protein